MGCGSSSAAQIQASAVSIEKSRAQRNNNQRDVSSPSPDNVPGESVSRSQCLEYGDNSADINDNIKPASPVRTPTPNVFENKENAKNAANARPLSTISGSTTGAPRGIAFEVNLGPGDKTITSRPPPKRFQSLEPLSVPTLTAEMLEEKQRVAEEKREKERQKIISASRKSSKRRRELMAAKDFEKAQQQYIEIEKSQQSAGKNRTARQQEIIDKQKKREERARRAREKAKRIEKMQNEEVDFDVEKDECFNADDDADSWLGDGESTKAVSVADSEERIYSGRSSPVKKVNPNAPKDFRFTSASTVDSFDAAFQRSAPSSGYASDKYPSAKERDEFFDS